METGQGMHQRDNDIYASAPLRRLLDEQTRVLTPELQRCFGTHALLLGAADAYGIAWLAPGGDEVAREDAGGL